MHPEDFMKLKAAGKLVCEGKMVEKQDDKGEPVQERQADIVIVKRPVYDPDTGQKIKEQDVELSISSWKATKVALEAQLAAVNGMIAELEAV